MTGEAVIGLTRRLAILAALLVVSASAADAQEVRVGALRSWPGHELLGSPRGFGVSLGYWFDRAGIRAGFEAHDDEFRSVGSTCVGLIPPTEDCSPEPRSETARLRAVTLVAPITVASVGRLDLRVTPGLRVARITSDQRGLTSGRTRSADKTMYGLDFGAEASLAPVRGWPLQVQVGGSVGVLAPLDNELVLDGYSPFEESIGVKRIWISLALAR